MSRRKLPYKVAVYGSLRKGLNNHPRLAKAKYIGNFKTKPSFTMYSLGPFPGVLPEGNTAIEIEVYEVEDETTALGLDVLEGYNGEEHSDSNLYNVIDIDTEAGKTELYIINKKFLGDKKEVESGDWVEYLSNR